TSEWTPTAATVAQRSSLKNSRYYSPDAISEQDLIADYDDETIQHITSLEQHTPLHLSAHMEAYSWSFDLANAFVVVRFRIVNHGDLLRNVYLGMYSQLVSNNKRLYSGWPPNAGTGPRAWFYDTQLSYVDSLHLLEEFFCQAPSACMTDDVNPYWAGLKFLGSLTKVPQARFHWQWWKWDPFSPLRLYDTQRYAMMADTLPALPTSLITYGTDSPVELLTLGPFPVLERADTLNVDFAFVAGRGRQDLETHAKFAQLAFDLGYVLPTPPPSPHVHVVPQQNALEVFWDGSPEDVVDPTSLHPDKHDFEGYRLYLGEDVENLREIFQADLRDSVPPNTGMEPWRLAEPRHFDGDTTTFLYHYRIEGLPDGFKRFVSVTSFDMGDARVPSLEGGVTQNMTQAVPGPTPSENAGRGVSVFPNPYKVEARWDAGAQVRDHYLWFVGLPPRARVRIYTLGGDLVKSFDFDSSTYRGQGARGVYDPSSTGGMAPPEFSGSMAAWDLITDRDQAVATGLYLYSVEDLRTGRRTVGKFTVIKSDNEPGY
ncbi:MAG TPA: hypothetical protein VMS93_05425, partial [Candidatus Saccharimonadales bacterium]|nr:hypothetical protein [Candidatus Saccharimonadales bacterium]